MIPDFEKLFEINVNLFQSKADGDVTPYYLSQAQFKDTINMHVFKNHLSYIKDIGAFAKKFVCTHCHKHFDHLHNWKRHEKVCYNTTQFKFPSGLYEVTDTILKN